MADTEQDKNGWLLLLFVCLLFETIGVCVLDNGAGYSSCWYPNQDPTDCF